MAEIPAPINQAVAIADKLVHAIEYDFGVIAFKTWARLQVVWLNTPVWGKLFDIAVDAVANWIYPFAIRIVDFKIIDIQTASEKSNYEKTRSVFHNAIQTGDKDAISKSKADFEAAFARGLHFSGV